MNNKNIFFIVLAIFTTIFLYTIITSTQTEQPYKSTWSYTKFIREVDNGIVNKAIINPDGSIDLETHSGDVFVTYAPNDVNLTKELLDHGVEIRVPAPAIPRPFLNLFLSWLPTLLLIAVIIYSIRRQSNMIGNGMGKSKHKLQSETGPKITFADVAGCDEAKADVQEIVDFLKDPKKIGRAHV